ncbi:hypothetical protein OAC51_03100 [Flavobacteriaceae bacterium]|nr:hypothetical protein [Flavobacteriaceae bacterium]
MKKKHFNLTIVITWIMCSFSSAQTPTEISFKLLNSKDHLAEEVDNLYSYRFKRKISDKTIAEISKLGTEYNVAVKRSSFSNESASVHLSFTSKKDSLKPVEFYFLFIKEDRKWKMDDYIYKTKKFETHFKTFQQAIELFKKKDYTIDTRSKEDIEWELERMTPKSLFSKEVVKKQHGIAIARVLNTNFVNKPLKARDLAYGLKVYRPSKNQLDDLKVYLDFALAPIDDNIETLKPKLKTLEDILKKAQRPGENLREWLDQKSMDWANYGIEYVDVVGFPGYCDGCYDLSFANLGRHRKGLLYVTNKKKLLLLKNNNYLTLTPIEGSWYYYSTF